jgi:chitodextrinase
MWGAAPHSWRRAAHVLAALTVCSVVSGLLVAPAQAAPNTSTAPVTQPGSFWGFEVDRTSYRLLAPKFVTRLRKAGVDTLVVRPGSLSSSRTARVRKLAARGRLNVLVPVAEGAPSSAGTIAAANASCRALKLASPGSRCAVYARTPASARAIAGFGAADVVLVQAGGGALMGLQTASGRIVAAATLPRPARFRSAGWRRAALIARSARTVDLAARLGSRKAALGAYLRLLRPIATAGDHRAPSMPQGLATTDLTGSVTTLTWIAAKDNRGVARYGVYLDGIRIREVAVTAASLPGLPCGGAHLIEVDAADATGNRSAKAVTSASVGDCAPLPPPPGLVAAYGFEETSGGATNDASGQGNHGSLNGPARTASGRYGRALAFDGVNDQVSVPDDASLDLAGSMTLEAWVRPSAAIAGWRTVVIKEQPNDLVYALYAAGTGYRPSGHAFVAGSDERVQAPGVLPADTWSHLATTYDGSTLRLYVNGALAGTLALTGPMAVSAGPFRIGGNTIWDEWFEGAIDEVRVYDHALTGAAIQSDMAEPIGAPAGDTAPPTVPGNVHTTGATATSVSLDWDAATDDVGVTGYGVYRDGTLVASPAGSSATVSGLVCGTSYTFAVDAVDAAGNRSAQASLSAATSACPPGPDTEAPTTPTGLAKSSSTQTGISVTWNASSDNVGVTGYGTYRDGAAIGSPTGTSYTFTGLDCGTSYSLAVDAADAAGNRSAKATITASTNNCPPPPDTQAPTTPTGLAPTATTQTSIAVSWNPSTDNVGVTGYGTYRNSAPIGNPTGTSYTFTGLTCGTSYTLAVDAADAAGNRSAQASITVATAVCPIPDTQAPTTPGNFHTTGQTTTSVSLAWNVSTDNIGVTGYGVYRNGSLVSSPTGLTATVSGLNCDTSYTFAVDAVDAAGNRSTQATLSASTSTCPPPGTADLYVATNGSSSSQCTQASPCSTFTRAYGLAQPGFTVQIAGGSYPSQTIDGAPKPAGSAPVVFEPAAGASVTVSSLRVNQGGAIEFRDFTVNNSTYNGCNCVQSGQSGYITREVTYRRIKMKQFFVRGADKISYIDGEVGPNGNEDGMNWITEPYQSEDPPTDILLDGMRIHDFTKHNSGAHVDCVGIGNADGVTIRNSRIWTCAHFAIIFGTDPSELFTRNLTIENNFLDCCDPSGGGFYSIGLGDGANVLIRFNSATLGFGWLNPNGDGVTNDVIDSNVIKSNSSANCSKAVWRYNVVGSGSACSNGIVAATGFMAAPLDLHLKAGSAAIGAGNPSSYPAADIDGNPRPAGGRADAGADETS